MVLSETGFVAITYFLIIWFVVCNLILAFYCLKDWFSGFAKHLTPRITPKE